MDQNSDSVLTRIELNFYSLLDSCLSKLRGAQIPSAAVANPALKASAIGEMALHSVQESRPGTGANWWTRLSQALVNLVIWMVLGFAAGYLIGMILPG